MPNPRSIAEFSQVPAPSIDTVQNATIVPVRDEKNLPCGVLRSDGTVCANSRTMLIRPRLTAPPAPPDPSEISDLAGRHLYGGVARVHFGHFLTETISRLWALDHLGKPVDSIIFQPIYHRTAKTILSTPLRQIVEVLSDGLPVQAFDTPVRAEELVVPSQGVGHFGWSTGTPEFRRFVRSRFEAAFAANGPDKLYISRARLANGDRHLDQEEQIEAMMIAAGYTIFHPERYSIREQAEHYLAARRVVGGDGSAFHFAAHLFQPGTRVGLIKRRHYTEVFAAIAEQIKAFGEVELSTLHPLLPAAEDVEKPPINMHRLERALRSKGFL